VILGKQVKDMFKFLDKVLDSLDQVLNMVSEGRTRFVIGHIADDIRRGSTGCTGQWGLLRGRSGHFWGLVV